MNASHLAAVALGDEIQRFGSYFGYAAIVGLGVLSLLYFTQAREVRRLREWAGRAPERDAEAAQRVQADAQRRVVATPAPVVPPAGPQTPAAQSADAARKAAAAAVMEKFQPPGATPAPAAALGPPGSLARPASPAGAAGGVPATAAAGATAAPAATGAAAPAPGSVAAAQPAAPAAPGSPATPGAAGEGAAGAPPESSAATAGAAAAAARQASAPARAPSFANGSGGQETHESDAARPSPLPDLPPRRPRPGDAAASDDDGGRSGARSGMIAAGVAAVLVIGVVLVLVLTSGGDKPPAGNAIGDTARPPAAASPPASTALTKAERAATPVAVLNGTTQTGLASAVARTIEKKGFTILATETNADQQIAATTVSYATGDERAARAVAKIMDVPASAVQPIDTNTSVAAAPEAKIVVLVGSDKSGAG